MLFALHHLGHFGRYRCNRLTMTSCKLTPVWVRSMTCKSIFYHVGSSSQKYRGKLNTCGIYETRYKRIYSDGIILKLILLFLLRKNNGLSANAHLRDGQSRQCSIISPLWADFLLPFNILVWMRRDTEVESDGIRSRIIDNTYKIPSNIFYLFSVRYTCVGVIFHRATGFLKETMLWWVSFPCGNIVSK